MSDSDPADRVDDGVEDDLFGDEDVGEAEVASEDEAASDRDEDLEREERAEERRYTKEQVVMGMSIYRHRIPKPKDGNLQVLRVPSFLKFIPTEYDPSAPLTDFDTSNAAAAHPKATIRWRRDAATGRPISNTNIYRWSDGSVTLAVGDDHYELQAKALAPKPGEAYHELKDSHYYAAAAHLASNLLLMVGHVSEQYTVLPNKEVEEEAVRVLADRLRAAAARGGRDGSDMEKRFITVAQDPELQKRQAELAEKERMKAQRRRETAAARLDPGAGGYGRRGIGLSVGDLEGTGARRGAGAGRKRGAPGGAAGGKRRRRRPDYDSDDDLPQGQRRQEEYERDEFVVSDEDDEEEEEGSEEEEDVIDDDEEEEVRTKKSGDGKRHKRQRMEEAEDEDDGDQDAEADMDDVDVPAPAPAAPSGEGRGRRRHVIEDDEE